MRKCHSSKGTIPFMSKQDFENILSLISYVALKATSGYVLIFIERVSETTNEF